MLKINNLLLLFLLTKAANVFSQVEFTIPIFADTVKAIPVTGNSIIVPLSGTYLQQMQTASGKLEKNEIVLRRRFSSNEYGIYLGTMNPEAYKRLSAFRYPGNMPFSKALKTKWYSIISENPDADIENIYFDNDLFYLENAAKVFYKDSIWWELAMIDALPSRITITSEPPGAQVFIDNNSVGYTPFTTGSIFNPSAIIRLEMKGYYITENLVDFQPGVFIEKNFALKIKPQFEDGSEIDLKAYITENTDDAAEIQQRITAINERVKKIAADSAIAVDSFNRSYPSLQKKDQFETSAEFQARKKQYDQQFLKEQNVLNGQYHAKVVSIQKVIPQLTRYKDELKSRVYTKYFDGSLLRLLSYDADSGFFPVEIAVEEKGFAFAFSGKLLIPREEARDFFYKGTGSGKIRLTYKNWYVNIPHNKEKGNYYLCFDTLNLRFKDKNYLLDGHFSFPNFIVDSREYKDYLIEKSLPGNATPPTHNESKLSAIAEDSSDSVKVKQGDSIDTVTDEKIREGVIVHMGKTTGDICLEDTCLAGVTGDVTIPYHSESGLRLSVKTKQYFTDSRMVVVDSGKFTNVTPSFRRVNRFVSPGLGIRCDQGESATVGWSMEFGFSLPNHTLSICSMLGTSTPFDENFEVVNNPIFGGGGIKYRYIGSRFKMINFLPSFAIGYWQDKKEHNTISSTIKNSRKIDSTYYTYSHSFASIGAGIVIGTQKHGGIIETECFFGSDIVSFPFVAKYMYRF